MILSFTACENGTQPATPPQTYVITLNLDGGSIDDDRWEKLPLKILDFTEHKIINMERK